MKQLLLAALFSLFATVAQAAGTIILLVDISSSINDQQMHLQIDSYTKAMQTVPSLQYVDVEVILFAQTVSHISSGSNAQAAAAFASYQVPRPEFRGATCLTNALEFVEELIPGLAHPIVIDISGDGEANCSDDDNIQAVLDRIAETGATVNTLYIENDGGIVDDYMPRDHHTFYQDLVRNNGFSMRANGFEDFEIALYEKLILEVGMLIKP